MMECSYIQTLEGVTDAVTDAFDLTIGQFEELIRNRRQKGEDLYTAVYKELMAVKRDYNEDTFNMIALNLQQPFREYSIRKATEDVLKKIEQEYDKYADFMRQQVRKWQAKESGQMNEQDIIDMQDNVPTATVVDDASIDSDVQIDVNEGGEYSDQLLVTSGSEFTPIDEAYETISYVDETGALHVEQMAKGGIGWLLAAAAFLFLT